MTFNQIAESLPNRFHDAELQRFEMDYVQRVLRFELVVWIGDMDDSRIRELYQPARVTVNDVAYLVIEPPDANYPWFTPGSMRIDTGEGQPENSKSSLPPAPVGTAITWMYIESLNTFLLFAAADALLEWTGASMQRS